VNGVSFNVEIQPDLDSAIDAARQICSLGEQVNITEAQIPECVDGVVRMIRESYTKLVMETRSSATNNNAEELPATPTAEPQP
jgi:hypothetical protein